MLSNLIIALLVSLASVIFYWQRDKSTFLVSLKGYWLLHVIVFLVTAFLTGYLIDSQVGRKIFQVLVGVAIIFLWNWVTVKRKTD